MAISVKKLGEKDKVVSYLVKGVSPAFINSIRRSMMLHSPSLAIENVSIYENDAAMFDEFLAHRLGMLPLKTDLKGYKLGDKVKLVLEKEGPCTVYSKDIKSTDPKIEVVDKNVPLTRLGKGNRIKIEMEAVMGTGEEHAKWQPALISFKEIPELVVGKDCNAFKECVEACPVNVLEMKGSKVVLKDSHLCSLCNACIDVCNKDCLKLRFEEGNYIFLVEPFGSLSAKEVVSQAVKELLDKTNEFGKALKKAK